VVAAQWYDRHTQTLSCPPIVVLSSHPSTLTALVAAGPLNAVQALDLPSYLTCWHHLGPTTAAPGAPIAAGAVSLWDLYHTLRAAVDAPANLPPAVPTDSDELFWGPTPEPPATAAVATTAVTGASAGGMLRRRRRRVGAAESLFEPHLDVAVLDAGVKSGILYRGIVRVNRNNPKLATVDVAGADGRARFPHGTFFMKKIIH
jgi:hypothetical protein